MAIITIGPIPEEVYNDEWEVEWENEKISRVPIVELIIAEEELVMAE